MSAADTQLGGAPAALAEGLAAAWPGAAHAPPTPPPNTPGGAAHPARQSALLAQLRGDAAAAGAGLAGHPAQRAQGLAAYQANAAATAPRALAAAYPSLARWLGEATFAAVARRHWQAHPPRLGDLACWGDALPEAIAQDPAAANEPWLADLARLDWAVHRASSAADDEQPAQGLLLLGQADPAALTLRLRAGTAVVGSPHPIVAVWQALHGRAVTGQAGEGAGADLAAAHQALRQDPAQSAWVTRGGGSAVQVLALDQPGAAFTQALLRGRDLDAALQLAGAGLDFEAWLILALQQGALAEVTLAPGPPA